MWNPFRRKEQRSEPTTIEEFLSYMGVNNTGAGEFVSPQTAESLPAVMNAVTVISEAVASMPCYLYALKEDKLKDVTELVSESKGVLSTVLSKVL